MYDPDNYLAQVVESLFVYQKISFFVVRESAVFIFSKLLAVFKDPIQNGDRIPVLLADLHIP